jgi:hypothetical protein
MTPEKKRAKAKRYIRNKRSKMLEGYRQWLIANGINYDIYGVGI